MSSPKEFVAGETTLPERVVDDLRRYLLQRSLTIIDDSPRTLDSGVIHSGRAVLRGLDCAVDLYCSNDSTLLLLCAKPATSWVFGDCFPEIPDTAAVNDFFFGNPPQEHEEPLLSKIGLDSSVWVLASAADEKLIAQNARDVLAKMDTWPKNGNHTGTLVAGLNMFGRPSFGDSDYLRGDDLLNAVLPKNWDLNVQANVEYNAGAPALSLPIPLLGKELQLGPCRLTELIVLLSTPMYYVRHAPAVRLEAKLDLGDTTFEISADYPLDGDIVEARLEVEAGKPLPFIGNIPGLPDLEPATGTELTVGVSLSKSERALKKAYLDLLLRREWVIVPDVLAIANPEIHFLVLDPVAETRQVVARVAGELIIDGSRLVVSGNYAAYTDYSEGQFTVSLDPGTPLSLGKLVHHLLGRDADSDSTALPEHNIDALLFECDLNGHIFMETSLSVPWKLALTSDVSLELKELRFLFEQWNESKRFRARADLDLGGLPFSLSGDYSSANGWSFKGATYPGKEINIGAFVQEVATELGTGETIPPSLADLSLQDVAFSLNTKTNAFRFTITTTFPVGRKGLHAVVTIEKDENELQFGGTITVAGAEFTLDFKSGEEQKVLKASWTEMDHRPGPDLMTLSDHDIAGLEDFATLLRPKEAELTLNLKEDAESLSLSCGLETGRAGVLIAKHGNEWIAAIRFEAPPISTGDLGPLGDALKPHDIRLDKLVIAAASAAAPADLLLTLDGQDYPVTKGLLLEGALEFQGTSFSFPFECRLSGGRQEEKTEALQAEGTGEITSETATLPAASAGASPAPVEGENNVAVGRTIGPVTFRKARLEYRDKRVYVLLDASLESGGFALDLDGFNINFPLEVFREPSELTEIGVGLDGLSISYSKPPLTISGGFAKTTPVGSYVDYLYEGELVIEAATFQVTVLGSYGFIYIDETKKTKKPSLFLYGTYAGVVGGPPAFFVTGLALGGGYNTRLVLPPIEQVAEFSLVQAVTAPETFASGGTERLRAVVQPSYGDYWLAAGVKFTSFKLADSFALFSVSFGTRLQFALLGLTKFTMPAGAEEGKCTVYAELAIRAVLDPEAGVFSIEGRLTQNSYVFTKEIHLTGGFAFFVWFGDAREAGDFVISLGGYHPAFPAPPHYPVVPRVGIRGLIGPLNVTGEAYLALTPSCLMAGLKLEAVYQRGRIGATFVAYADFVVEWAPFHYDAGIGIGVAVTYRAWRTFKMELSANLHVWGPPFAGRARVSYSIVSFTIEFGHTSGAEPPPLQWDEFQKAFLPSSDSNAGRLSTIRITEGLIREVKQGEVIYRIVNPHELMIETDSVVPCSEVCVGEAEVCVGEARKTGTAEIGIRPMKKAKLKSRHDVSILRNDGSRGESPVEAKFKLVQWSQKNYPEALWSAKAASGKPEAGMIKDVPSGVVLRVRPETPQHHLGPFLIEKLKWEKIQKSIPWLELKVPPANGEQFYEVPEVNSLRRQIRDCLANGETGERSWNEIVMKNTSANPKERFQAPPKCAALGQSL